jgi:hypothetical protein
MIIFPMTALANEITSPQLFVEEYNARYKQFRVVRDEDGNLSDKKPYGYIITTLQKFLNATIVAPSVNEILNPTEASRQNQADYHLLVIDIPYSYNEREWVKGSDKWYERLWYGTKSGIPDITPSISKNKYAEAPGIETYSFSSFWIRGELYIKDGKPVGGNIIIPISGYAREVELYQLAHHNWDIFLAKKDSTVVDEMSVPGKVWFSTVELYKKIYSEINYKEQKNILTEKYIEEIFAPKGKGALTIARMLYLDGYGHADWEFGKHKFDTCKEYSAVFYASFYENLFTELFKKTTFSNNNKTIHNITISSETLQSLHKEAGNYNCFSPDFKEIAK